jgi:hypothetical protein
MPDPGAYRTTVNQVGDFTFLIMFAGFLAFIVTMIVRQRAELARKRARNYAWYEQNHPKCVVGDRVYCFSCNGQRIQVRNLMQGTYLRDHFCAKCGTTLYYTPEG